MILTGKTCWKRWRDSLGMASAAGFVCLAAVAGEGKPVREKVLFSGTGNSAALPSSKPKDDVVSKPFEFLGPGNSVSGVVSPAMSPSTLSSYPHNSRLQDVLEQRLDQKRNWIFGQSADFGSALTADEVLSLGAFGDTETKPKTALEKFLAGSGSKTGRAHAEQTGSDEDKRGSDKPYSRLDREDRTREEPSSPLTNPFDSARIMTAGFSFANDFLGLSTGPARMNDVLNPTPADPIAKVREDRKRADEFRKILDFAGPNPLTTGLSAIHLGLENAPQELTPIPAPRLGELPGINRDAYNPLRTINSPSGVRPSGLEDRTAKILGPSSLAPAVSVPTESPARQVSPAALDFPKRQF